MLLLGTAGSASLNFPFPNQPSLLGFTFYTQGLVLDAAQNVLGATTSDAAVGIVGL